MKRSIFLIFIFLMVQTNVVIAAEAIPMKIKKVIYDFFLTLDQKNIDTSAIVCQMQPKDNNDYKGAILNQETDIPEVKVSSLFSWKSVLYIDAKMIASIREQNYTMSEDLKYQIVYRLGLLKFALEKSKLYPDLFLWLGFGTTVLSLANLEIAIFAWFEGKIKDSLILAKSGLAHAGISAIMYGIYFLTRKNLNFVEEQKELDDIRRHAEQLAWDTLKIERLN